MQNPPRISTGGFTEVLAKNTEATSTVREVAYELAVVHAVLKSMQVAYLVDDGHIAALVEQTRKVEQILSETTEKLIEVNSALAKQHASLTPLPRPRAA